MHEIDSGRKSRSGITFCGQAFFFPGVHAFPSSAHAAFGHRAPLPMQISRPYVVRFRPTAIVSECVFNLIDKGCAILGFWMEGSVVKQIVWGYS